MEFDWAHIVHRGLVDMVVDRLESANQVEVG